MPTTPHHPTTTTRVKPEEQSKGITLGKGIETKKCMYNDFNCITIINTFSARRYFSFSIIVTNSSWIRRMGFCLSYQQIISFVKIQGEFSLCHKQDFEWNKGAQRTLVGPGHFVTYERSTA